MIGQRASVLRGKSADTGTILSVQGNDVVIILDNDEQHFFAKEELKLDFWGNPISIGDIVAFMPERYREFRSGKVVGITPHQIRIEYFKFKDGAPIIQTRYPGRTIKKPA